MKIQHYINKINLPIVLPSMIILAMIFSGCKKDLEVVRPDYNAEAKTMDQVIVPEGFNWHTERTVRITVTSSVGGLLIIKSKTGTLYEKAMLTPGDAYETKVVVPMTEQEVVIINNGITRHIDVYKGDVSCSF